MLSTIICDVANAVKTFIENISYVIPLYKQAMKKCYRATLKEPRKTFLQASVIGSRSMPSLNAEIVIWCTRDMYF